MGARTSLYCRRSHAKQALLLLLLQLLEWRASAAGVRQYWMRPPGCWLQMDAEQTGPACS